MATVYRKTAKGSAEIETRAHRLAPRLRGALILVDGRRGDDELSRLVPAGDAPTMLRILRDEGFIAAVESRAMSAAAVPTPAPVAAAAPVASVMRAPSSPPAVPAARGAAAVSTTSSVRDADLAAARSVTQREAVRLLLELVGPMAEALAVKIERASGDAELRQLLGLARQVISNTRGRGAAEQFAQRLLPPG